MDTRDARPPRAATSDCARLMLHLALAAEERVDAGDLSPEEATRHAALAAYLRDVPARAGRPDDAPVVTLSDGRVVPLIDLFADAWQRHGRHACAPGIEPAMVEAAKQLLRELAWALRD